jgi:hypothetical protein
MKFNAADLLKLTGLASDKRTPAASDALQLSGAATDPRTGLLVSLSTDGNFDKNGNLASADLVYWRHWPYGESRSQSLISLKTKASRSKKTVDIDQLWVGAHCVYDAKEDDGTDPLVQKRIMGVLEAFSRLNTHLRKNAPVEQAAKILNDCYVEDILGESLTLSGLKDTGGFQFSLSPYFMRQARKNQPFTLRQLERHQLMGLFGARINTMEPDRDLSASRKLVATDPQAQLTFDTGVKFEDRKNGDIHVTYYIDPRQDPEGVEAARIRNLIRFEFSPHKDSKGETKKDYVLKKAFFAGEQIDLTDTKTILKLFGAAQASGRDMADNEYPRYMDHFAAFDLLDNISQFPVPPKLEQEGGELLYASLHGSSFEQRIEAFGDQIGAADVFFHRGLKSDGTVSSVAVALDFPFASGGAKSNVDGAIPDYLPFWDDLQAFFFTHDHYDHADGMAYYAKAGMMKDKNVYATAEVKYFLDKKMDFLKVPRSQRPRIHILDDESPICIRDDKGNARLWVQPAPNQALHSARCTPYMVTGCYGDKHYNGTALSYGDANGITDKGYEIFQKAARALAKEEGVTKSKVDFDITTTFHDPTAINYEGNAPDPDEVESNLSTILDIVADDKGVLMTPISTNDAEYTIGMNVAHRGGRDLTAVGRNAELRVACKNLFGVKADFDLRELHIDPFEESHKADPLIPQAVLTQYFESVLEPDDADIERARKSLYRQFMKDHDSEDRKAVEEAESYAEEGAYDLASDRKREAARVSARTAVKEILEPSEREHQKSTSLYMLDSLFRHGAVVFENDVNGYLMWMAIRDRMDQASIRATRTSQLAKGFRLDPKRLMIFITGTQGNAEERFSTLQKFKDFFSLLDVNESVRNTGYKINAADFIPVITQPAIVGNHDEQDRMINDLIRNRGVTLIGAYMNGFKVYNPKDKRDKIMAAFRKQGWKPELDPQGNVSVSGVPIHVHGHGFREDLKKIATNIPSDLHEVHHVPSHDNYMLFRELMAENGLKHAGGKPDDFRVFRINRHAKAAADKFKQIAQLNPSYVLVSLERKYGQYFGGWLKLDRVTMLRNEGTGRKDGMMVRSDNDGVYHRKSAQQEWDAASNPHNFKPHGRTNKIAPSMVDRAPQNKPMRSRPVFSAPVPENKK